jgi:drug/metabolite transporter (DMT)-like permease
MNFGALCAFAASVTWAIGSAQYIRLSRTYSAFTINFTRALVAFPLFILTVWISAGSFSAFLEMLASVSSTRMGWFFVSIFASYGVGDALFFLSSQVIGIPAALAIASIYPIWSALIDFIFHGQALSGAGVFGLVLTLAGVATVILSLPPERAKDVPEKSTASGTSPRVPQKMRAIAFALITSLFWALNTYAVAKGASGMSATLCNIFRMGIALIFTFILGRVFAPKSRPFIKRQDLLPVSWAFVIEAYFGSLSYMIGLRDASLVVASTLSSLAPVVSVPVALALRLEVFSWVRTLGVIVTVIGLWFLVN